MWRSVMCTMHSPDVVSGEITNTSGVIDLAHLAFPSSCGRAGPCAARSPARRRSREHAAAHHEQRADVLLLQEPQRVEHGRVGFDRVDVRLAGEDLSDGGHPSSCAGGGGSDSASSRRRRSSALQQSARRAPEPSAVKAARAMYDSRTARASRAHSMLRRQALTACLLLAALVASGCETFGHKQPPPPPPPARRGRRSRPKPTAATRSRCRSRRWPSRSWWPPGPSRSSFRRAAARRRSWSASRSRAASASRASRCACAARAGRSTRPAGCWSPTPPGMTRDRLTARKTTTITLNAGGTRYRFQVPVAELSAVSRPGAARDRPRVVEDLERILAPERVLTRPIDRLGRSADASIYRLIPRRSCARAASPRSAQLFAWARQKRRHLTFRTAGTSLSGQAVSDDVLVELAPFFRQRARARRRRADLVAAGRRGRPPEPAAGAPPAQRIGPDPASIDAAMIGGILANNSSGMCCGVAQNSYHTLEAWSCCSPAARVVDTARARRGRRSCAARSPRSTRSSLALRDEIRARPGRSRAGSAASSRPRTRAATA